MGMTTPILGSSSRVISRLALYSASENMPDFTMMGCILVSAARKSAINRRCWRLPNRRAIIAAHGLLVEMMLEVQPISFDFVFRKHIGAVGEDTPPTEPGPSTRRAWRGYFRWLRAAPEPAKK